MPVTVKVGSTTLTQRKDVQWFDPRRGPGNAQFSLANDDTQNSLLEIGTLVTFSLGSTVFMYWNVEKINRVAIDGEESKGQITTYSGRSTIAQLDNSHIYPATGIRDLVSPIFTGRIGTKPYDDVRRMGAPDPSYDHSGWDAAVEALPAIGAFMPEGWRDTDGPQWIWSEALDAGAHPAGRCYLASPSFSTLGTFSVDIDFGMLNGGRIYMDGALVAAIDPVTELDGGSRARQVTVETTDGTHSIVAVVDHYDDTQAGGLLLSVYETGTDTVVIRTSDSWKALGYPTTLPGLTSGAIDIALFDESIARGELDGWDYDFSATTDTGSTVFPQIPGDVVVQVGDSMLDLQAQLEEGWQEYAALAQNGGFTLSAWVVEGVPLDGGGVAPSRGADTDVEIEVGRNALEVTHEVTDSLATVVLMRWGDGYIEGQIDDAVTAYGRRTSMLRISEQMDGPAALWTAYASLLPISEAATAITVRYDPDTGEEPYDAFWCADRITAPTITGGTSLYPVESIAGEEDEVGNISWTLELATSTQVLAQIWQRWLGRNNNGTLNGRSASASPSSPSIRKTVTLDWTRVSFGGGGNAVATLDDIGDPWAAEATSRVVKLELKCTDAGTGDTTLTLYKNGSSTGDSVTLGADETVSTVYPSSGAVFELADVMWPKVTAAGGATGINLTVWLAATGA